MDFCDTGSIPLSIVSETKTDELFPFKRNFLVRCSMREAERREINWKKWQQILGSNWRAESPSWPSFAVLCILSAAPLCSAGMAGGNTDNPLITSLFCSELDKCFWAFLAEMFSVLRHPYPQNTTNVLSLVCRIHEDLVVSLFWLCVCRPLAKNWKKPVAFLQLWSEHQLLALHCYY